jgi:Flp pilus assembly protein CpaB
MQWAQKLLSTRSGTLVLAGIAAILAAVIFLVYLNRYRQSVNESSSAATVLVAKNLIPKGTSGEAIGEQGLFQVVETTKGQLLDGALVDPAALRGRVVVADIFPGHQLTVADFTTTVVASLGATLVGDQRAIALPVDSAHGMIGKIQVGDHVDVLVGFNLQRVDRNGVPVGSGQGRPIIKTVMEDITVLTVPGGTGGGVTGGGGRGSNVTLKVTPQQAADLAFAADRGKIWLVLRPRTGGAGESPKLVTAETLLLGVPPVAALHSFGGR